MGMETLTSEKELHEATNREVNHCKGNGGFLVTHCPRGSIFSREQLNEEQLEIGKTALNFCMSKAEPLVEKTEKQMKDENGVPYLVKLFKEAGELGLLCIDIPERFEGMGMDLATNMHMVEAVGRSHGGFAVIVLSHIGIGTMPILLFGNEEQKAKYLPKLATGEWLGCYALTEPGSGSDALSGRTEAKLDGDYYILNGSKQFITNGGWADTAVVFAKIDGLYSALIVELDQPGVVRGAEEQKMGIKGSSTTSLTFENVKVPKENLLGNIGDAANIALNILNIGRLELGFGTLGGTKSVIDKTIKFVKERKQFGRPIIEFDMLKSKMADMVVKSFGIDTICYRTVAPIDRKIENRPEGEDFSRHIVNSLRSYAMESSICKVEGSEALYEICEKSVKMHGGYGYIQEYEVERSLRDSIINMIYEGTNEINRLVIFDFLVRNIYNGGIDYRTFMEEVDEVLRTRKFGCPEDDILGAEKSRLYAAKYIAAYLVQRAILHYGKDVSNNQQAIENISNILIDVYVLDSVLARVHYLMENRGCEKAKVELAIAKVTAIQRLEKIRTTAKRAILDLAHDYQLQKMVDEVNWLCGLTESYENVVPLKRVICDAVVEKGHYYFN